MINGHKDDDEYVEENPFLEDDDDDFADLDDIDEKYADQFFDDDVEGEEQPTLSTEEIENIKTDSIPGFDLGREDGSTSTDLTKEELGFDYYDADDDEEDLAMDTNTTAKQSSIPRSALEEFRTDGDPSVTESNRIDQLAELLKEKGFINEDDEDDDDDWQGDSKDRVIVWGDDEEDPFGNESTGVDDEAIYERRDEELIGEVEDEEDERRKIEIENDEFT